MAWPSLKPFIITNSGAETYLKRWYILPRNNWFNIYLHKFCRSDDDRALHDHPYDNMSILLRGTYYEVLRGSFMPDVRRRRPFRPVFRRAETAHRIVLLDNQPAWSLFVTLRRRRDWGFHCPNGWVPWQKFIEVTPDSAIGKGCE